MELFICIGLNTKTNKLEQVCLRRYCNTSEDLKQSLDEYERPYWEEYKKIYSNMTWFKIDTTTQLTKVTDV